MRKVLRALVVGALFVTAVGCSGSSGTLPTASKPDPNAKKPDAPVEPPKGIEAGTSTSGGGPSGGGLIKDE